jgi:hypothetical protein
MGVDRNSFTLRFFFFFFFANQDRIGVTLEAAQGQQVDLCILFFFVTFSASLNLL